MEEAKVLIKNSICYDNVSECGKCYVIKDIIREFKMLSFLFPRTIV